MALHMAHGDEFDGYAAIWIRSRRIWYALVPAIFENERLLIGSRWYPYP